MITWYTIRKGDRPSQKNTENKVGSYIEVEFDVPRAGAYDLGVRYIHGKPDNRPAELSINGTIVNPSLSFSSTGEWTAWTTVSNPVDLEAGKNVVRLSALSTQGLVNIDHILITSKK